MARLTPALLVLAAAWQLVSSASGMPMSCAGDTDNCKASGCCSTSGYTCFEKDQYWASCKATCTPGINPDDPPEYRQPWSCAVASPSSDSDTFTSSATRALYEEDEEDEETGASRRRLRSGRVEVISGSPKLSSLSSRVVGVAVAVLAVVAAQP